MNHPIEYILHRITETQGEEFIPQTSPPQWIECFGVYKTSDSGFRVLQDPNGTKTIQQYAEYGTRHVLLTKSISERVYKIYGHILQESSNPIPLYDHLYGSIGDFVFTGNGGWLSAVSDQYMKGEEVSAYHIRVDGKPRIGCPI